MGLTVCPENHVAFPRFCNLIRILFAPESRVGKSECLIIDRIRGSEAHARLYARYPPRPVYVIGNLKSAMRRYRKSLILQPSLQLCKYLLYVSATLYRGMYHGFHFFVSSDNLCRVSYSTECSEKCGTLVLVSTARKVV